MGIESMARVTTEVTFENAGDLRAAHRGLRPADQVKRVVIPDALVDTGTTMLSLPTRLIQQLGLARGGLKHVTGGVGPAEAGMYEAVRLTIMGRSCTMDAMEVPDGIPALIGRLPLEHLDLVVDLRSLTLIGNQAHGGEHILELYRLGESLGGRPDAPA